MNRSYLFSFILGIILLSSCVKNLEVRVPQNVSIYPSPCRDVVSLAYTSVNGESIDFKLANGKGELLVEGQLGPSNNVVTIDVSREKAGALFVTFTDGVEVYREKVIKIE